MMTIEEIEKRLLRLETFHNEWKDMPKWDLHPLYEEVKELKRFQDITSQQYEKVINKKHPHKCPVCDFSGAIMLETIKEITRFSSVVLNTNDGRSFIWCTSCKGEGIVWG